MSEISHSTSRAYFIEDYPSYGNRVTRLLSDGRIALGYSIDLNNREGTYQEISEGWHHCIQVLDSITGKICWSRQWSTTPSRTKPGLDFVNFPIEHHQGLLVWCGAELHIWCLSGDHEDRDQPLAKISDGGSKRPVPMCSIYIWKSVQQKALLTPLDSTFIITTVNENIKMFVYRFSGKKIIFDKIVQLSGKVCSNLIVTENLMFFSGARSDPIVGKGKRILLSLDYNDIKSRQEVDCKAEVMVVVWHDSGIMLGHEDGSTAVWSREPGKKPVYIMPPYQSPVTALAVLSSQQIASGHRDGCIRVWLGTEMRAKSVANKQIAHLAYYGRDLMFFSCSEHCWWQRKSAATSQSTCHSESRRYWDEWCPEPQGQLGCWRIEENQLRLFRERAPMPPLFVEAPSGEFFVQLGPRVLMLTKDFVEQIFTSTPTEFSSHWFSPHEPGDSRSGPPYVPPFTWAGLPLVCLSSSAPSHGNDAGDANPRATDSEDESLE